MLLEIDLKNFPKLNDLKKKKIQTTLYDIIKIGYDIYFPSNEIINNTISDNILYNKIDEKFNIFDNKFELFSENVDKLIGVSNNSSKKGNFAENMLEDIFNKRYGDIKFERKSTEPHSGDAWLYLPDNKIIMLESKNYTKSINNNEIIKLNSDMINHNIKWGILVSFNSNIQGKKELDFYTFTHNNEVYSVITISNLSNDITRLDLVLQIIRQLINNFNDFDKFPWIVNDINISLYELNQILDKNYKLRDAFNTTEKNIQETLSCFYSTLRDYQYDINNKINELINKIKITMNESIQDTDNIFINTYRNKKIFDIIFRLNDKFKQKKWLVSKTNEENKWDINNDNNIIGSLKIMNDKVNICINDIKITLVLGKDKEIKKHIDILNIL